MIPASLALTPVQRRALFVDGLWRFTPAPESGNYRERRRKHQATYGMIRKIALDFVAGIYGTEKIAAVAEQKRVAYESLKAAVWRVQNEGKNSRVKAVA